MTSNEWSGLYVYLLRDSSATEKVLRENIAPILDQAHHSGLIGRWYFLRYFSGGPHLRLRVEADRLSTLEVLSSRIAESIPSQGSDRMTQGQGLPGLAPPGSEQLQPDGTVHIVAYEPETDRYGGVEALALAEEFFVDSSELALTVIAATGDNGNKRRAVAADLILVFAHAMGWSGQASVRHIRHYFFGWDAAAEVSRVRSRLLIGAARATFAQNVSYWASRWQITLGESALPGNAEAETDRTSASPAPTVFIADENVYSCWAHMVRSYRNGLRERQLDERAVSRAAWSQMHLLLNRIGISVPDERTLSWLATIGLQQHLDSEDAQLHEHLRYLHSISYRGAGALSAASEPRAAPSASIVSLSLSPRSPSPTLAAALRRRRSRLAHFDSRLGISDLADLLACLAQSGRRTYPSAGALYPTEFLIYCRNVPNVEPGTYAFVPGSTQLIGTSILLDDSDLEAVSPYLTVSEPGGSTDLSRTQFIVFVATDLSKLEPKYGASSLKLAWLEAGHASQTLLLAASALRMGSLVVGGFDDEVLNASLHLDGVHRFVSHMIIIGGIPPD